MPAAQYHAGLRPPLRKGFESRGCMSGSKAGVAGGAASWADSADPTAWADPNTSADPTAASASDSADSSASAPSLFPLARRARRRARRRDTSPGGMSTRPRLAARAADDAMIAALTTR